jgi:hypothetical protein
MTNRCPVAHQTAEGSLRLELLRHRKTENEGFRVVRMLIEFSWLGRGLVATFRM